MSVDFDKGRATLRQAVSNRDFAEAVLKQYGPDAPNTQQPSYWCHIIAQSQQAVEKSTKALCTVNGITPPFSHDVTRHVVAMLKRPEHVRYSREIYSRISRLFSPDVRGQITTLCQLAPRHGDDRDHETLRNTEYAYRENKKWLAPCDSCTFSQQEVRDFFALARRVVTVIDKIVDELWLAHGRES